MRHSGLPILHMCTLCSMHSTLQKSEDWLVMVVILHAFCSTFSQAEQTSKSKSSKKHSPNVCHTFEFFSCSHQDLKLIQCCEYSVAVFPWQTASFLYYIYTFPMCERVCCVFVPFRLRMKLKLFLLRLLSVSFHFVCIGLCLSNDFLYVPQQPKPTFTLFKSNRMLWLYYAYNIECVCKTASKVLNGMAKTNPDEKKHIKRGRERGRIKWCANSQVDYYIA